MTRSNPAPPWVYRAMEQNFDAILALRKKWQPVDIQDELGCGGGGCAFRTSDPGLVWKLTAHYEEYRFATLAKKHEHPGVVGVSAAARLPNKAYVSAEGVQPRKKTLYYIVRDYVSMMLQHTVYDERIEELLADHEVATYTLVRPEARTERALAHARHKLAETERVLRQTDIANVADALEFYREQLGVYLYDVDERNIGWDDGWVIFDALAVPVAD